MKTEQINKVLTVKQPFAELICLGIKDVENRTWKTAFRGRCYIHSAANSDKKANLTYSQKIATNHIENFDFLERAIIGEVDIIDCVQNYHSIWAEEGQWHFVLANAVFYVNPITNVKGKLGFWNYNKPQEDD